MCKETSNLYNLTHITWFKCMYSYEPREIPREWEVEKFSRSFTARTQQGKSPHFIPLPPTVLMLTAPCLSLAADLSGIGKHTKQTTQGTHKPTGRTQGCWTTNKEKITSAHYCFNKWYNGYWIYLKQNEIFCWLFCSFQPMDMNITIMLIVILFFCTTSSEGILCCQQKKDIPGLREKGWGCWHHQLVT